MWGGREVEGWVGSAEVSGTAVYGAGVCGSRCEVRYTQSLYTKGS